MPLTYTKVNRREEVSREEVELKPYDHWGMFTSAGNRRLRTLAQQLLDKMEKETDHLARQQLIVWYLKKINKVSSFETYSEASDTAVREYIWDFIVKVCGCVDISTGTADDLWEKYYRPEY